MGDESERRLAQAALLALMSQVVRQSFCRGAPAERAWEMRASVVSQDGTALAVEITWGAVHPCSFIPWF